MTITRREASRRLAARDEQASEHVVERDDGNEDVLDVLARRVDIERALRPLSDQDRRLLWLRYGADLTQPATAAALAIPEGTVKVRLHRLRRRLRDELETS